MRPRTTTVVTMSLGAVVFGTLLLFLAVRYIAANPNDANLGAAIIRVRAERMAETIDTGGPVPFEDPYEGRSRDVFLQHTGSDPKKGWVLVLAYPAGREGEKKCAITWEAKREVFRSPCTKSTHPPDGTGLTTFPAPVEDGKVVIDLR